MDVAIQVFAYDEKELGRTLDAIAAQWVPDWLEPRYEAWVTPAAPAAARGERVAHSVTAREWDQAAAHDVFRAREAPPGKLSSRNVAHDEAVATGADAIVAWDADAPPLHDDALARLLAPIRRGEAVATNARPTSPWTVVGTATNVVGWVHDLVQPHIHGQCHALTAAAWAGAGPFRVDEVDETTMMGALLRDGIRIEEEFAFRRRVDAVGPVVDTWDVRVRNDTRRTYCHFDRMLGRDQSPYCRRMDSDVTFHPREDQWSP